MSRSVAQTGHLPQPLQAVEGMPESHNNGAPAETLATSTPLQQASASLLSEPPTASEPASKRKANDEPAQPKKRKNLPPGNNCKQASKPADEADWKAAGDMEQTFGRPASWGMAGFISPEEQGPQKQADEEGEDAKAAAPKKKPKTAKAKAQPRAAAKTKAEPKAKAKAKAAAKQADAPADSEPVPEGKPKSKARRGKAMVDDAPKPESKAKRGKATVDDAPKPKSKAKRGQAMVDDADAAAEGRPASRPKKAKTAEPEASAEPAKKSKPKEATLDDKPENQPSKPQKQTRQRSPATKKRYSRKSAAYHRVYTQQKRDGESEEVAREAAKKACSCNPKAYRS